MRENAPRNAATRRLQILLRIKHPALDPGEITRTLKIEPEETIAHGTSVSRGVRRLHSESYWLAELSFPSRAEIAAEAVRTASRKSPSKTDASRLRKLTSGLSDFTSPKLSAIKEHAAPHSRGRSRDAKEGDVKKEETFDFGRVPAFQEFLLLTRIGTLEAHQEFFRRIRIEGGSITLLVHRPDLAAPFTVSVELARRLAELGIDLEID